MNESSKTSPIIEVKNLRKEYSVFRKSAGLFATFKNLFNRKETKIPAVKDVSFSIKEGELVGFLGPNGAGKTTTLKILSGILHPSGGEIRVLGMNPWKRDPKLQKSFALVMGQKNQLIKGLPAIDSFNLIRSIYDISDEDYKESMEELTELFDASEFLDVPTRKLSLGQRMKCELVAALLHRPKILFLDEPTIGLDVVAQKNIREFIKRYNQKKKTTIILTSHYMDDIRELCERVIIINHGTVIYDGKLSVLIDKYAPFKIIKITGTAPFDRSMFDGFLQVKSPDQNASQATIAEFDPYAVSFKVPRAEAKHIAAKLIQSDLPIDDVLIDEVSIDDVIREIFAGK